MHCGTELIWGCDNMLSEVTGVDLPLEEDSLVANYTCPHCNKSYEYFSPNPILGEEPYFLGTVKIYDFENEDE